MLPPLQELSPSAAPEAHVQFEFAEKNHARLVDDYLRQNSACGIPNVATDAAKLLFPEFQRDPIGANGAVQAPARLLAESIWGFLLSNKPDPNRAFVQFNTGSSASGKTSGFSPLPERQIGLRRESILDQSKRARREIEAILDSGRQPIIQLWYTNDPRINVDRMVYRAMRAGRTVPIGYLASSYVLVPHVVAKLMSRFAERLTVHSFDNSY